MSKTMPVEQTRDISISELRRMMEILRGYKNRYMGQRCFIIGNGPSLRAFDLDKINESGDFSIGSNRIYLIFSQTNWRPTLFTCVEQDYVRKSLREMSAIESSLKLITTEQNDDHWGKMFPVDGALPIRFKQIPDQLVLNKMPPFSEDITDCVYSGQTVTYVNIQIAAYMGFKEMILLGVDHCYAQKWYIPQELRNYDWDRNPRNYEPGHEWKGEIQRTEGVKNHFCDNYADGLFDGKGEDSISQPVEAATMAYKAAKQYAEAHGIKILNATRGGKLNVFKRVVFDSLFPKSKSVCAEGK